MSRLAAAALALLGNAALAEGAENHWAVIMAGSNGYDNYRHQADACHAYQIAKKNGIPEEQIILLAYDDIAHNLRNPFKGKIFNKPNGTDVYDGCKISYRGHKVNKRNFLKVLTGDTSAPGPVLKSTADDKVFVYFADHGGVGILGTPDIIHPIIPGGYIYAKELNAALDTMHSKGMYKQLLFYVEACESGSIFQNFLTAPNVKAVTAANAKESSWGFYCGEEAKVNGKNIGSCLGDEFSIRWMEDTDAADINKETVGDQFRKVSWAVKKSHVQKFGDSKDLDNEVLGDFQGNDSSKQALDNQVSPELADPEGFSSVNSRDIPVYLAYEKLRQASSLREKREAQAAMAKVLAARNAADEKFLKIATIAVGGDETKGQEMVDGDLEAVNNPECHEHALEMVVKSCGGLDGYTMRYSRLFANLCDVTGLDIHKIEDAIIQVCKKEEVVV